MNKVVMFLNSATLPDPCKGNFSGKRLSACAIEEKRVRICGSCYTSIPLKRLKGISFEEIKKKIHDNKVDFVELSSQKKGNLNKKVILKILEEFSPRVLLPVAKWIENEGDYYPVFDKNDKYLRGFISEELHEIQEILGLT